MSAWQSGLRELVEPHLLEAVRLAPHFARAHEALSQWYYDVGETDRALAHSEQAYRLAPRDPSILASHAIVLERAGQTDAAWRLIEPIVGSDVNDPRIGTLYARLAPSLKREREALAYVRRVLASRALTPPQAAQLQFASATLLDRLGEHDEAFRLAALARTMMPSRYDRRSTADRIQRQIDYFTPAKLRDLPRAMHGSRRPVFIIGMPRSGTTLVEQILASHPQVHGADELQVLSSIAGSAAAAPWAANAVYPEYLDFITSEAAGALADRYLSVLAALNITARYVTDKNPLNFLYLGLVAVLFPGCHVIHCTRDPLDTCVSCYMTLFASPNIDFTCDLASLGDFYVLYRRYMSHWREKLAFPMLEISYENMVADPERQIRRLLEYLDLPWDSRCLNFFDNDRRVTTPSRDQVRRPIYASSIGRWKRYEPHLAPLMSQLRPYLSEQL